MPQSRYIRALPLLLRPRVQGALNRFTRARRARSAVARDIMLSFFAAGIMFAIYRGVYFAIEKLTHKTNLVYLHPSMPLGLLLLTLGCMLVLSNAALAVGALYTSRDLDLIVASPLPRSRFFLSKAIEVIGASSWMVIVFGLPGLLAFGVSYNADPLFYPYAFFVTLPYLIIPGAIAILIVTILTSCIPAHRTHELFITLGGVAIICGYLAYKHFVPAGATFQDSGQITHLLSLISVPNTPWAPSYWAAVCLGEYLDPTGKNPAPYLGMLYSTATALLTLAFLAFRFLFDYSYSLSKSTGSSLKIVSQKSHARLVWLTPFWSPQMRALIVKEVKLFLRDITQAVQLIMLLGLTMIYLYNFKALTMIDDLPLGQRLWWQAILIIGNMTMGAFVMTAVATRFVFPSVSLEGQSFWILQKSPLTIREILRVKFWCWLIPLACISSIILGSGALAIHSEPHIVILSALTSCIICYGIVGVGIGFGAIFANFDWEHPSQLSASFGSLLYMITSISLVAINMFPTGILIFLRTLRNFDYHISTLEWYTVVTCGAVLLAYINFFAARWAMSAGEKSLLARMK